MGSDISSSSWANSYLLELSLWNTPRNRLFEFPVTVFIVHDLFLRDSKAAPATIVLFLSVSWICLISLGKWRMLPVNISEVEGCSLWGNAGAVKAYFKDFFCGLASLLTLFFSQNARFCCPLGITENVFDLPKETSHTRLPKNNPSYTFDKHTLWILPFVSHRNQSPHLTITAGATDYS